MGWPWQIEDHQDFTSGPSWWNCAKARRRTWGLPGYGQRASVGEDPLILQRRVGGAKHVHLKDYRVQGPVRGIGLICRAVGDGVIPFGEILKCSDRPVTMALEIRRCARHISVAERVVVEGISAGVRGVAGQGIESSAGEGNG
jgi:hypothetical protein